MCSEHSVDKQKTNNNKQNCIANGEFADGEPCVVYRCSCSCHRPYMLRPQPVCTDPFFSHASAVRLMPHIIRRITNMYTFLPTRSSTPSTHTHLSAPPRTRHTACTARIHPTLNPYAYLAPHAYPTTHSVIDTTPRDSLVARPLHMQYASETLCMSSLIACTVSLIAILVLSRP